MSKTKITGKAQATVEQMISYIKRVNPNVSAKVVNMIQFYILEGEKENIRGDIAFAQSCIETGNFNFKKSDTCVTLEQNNFCGMGVTRYGVKGNSFESPQVGIRAQIQHLKAYANTEKLKHTCVDPRFYYVKRGCAEYVEWLGSKENPKGYGWATGANYGTKILNVLSKIMQEKPNNKEYEYSSLYKVRNIFNDEKSQLGAYSVFENAKNKCDENTGYMIFTENGIPVYPLPIFVTANSDFNYYDENGNIAGSAKAGKYTVIAVNHSTGFGKLKSGAGFIPMENPTFYFSNSAENYLAINFKNAQSVYCEIETKHYAHNSGSNTLEEMRKNKFTSCNSSVSISAQLSGIFKKGAIIGHTPKDGKGGETKRNDANKIVYGIENLIVGTCDIIYPNCLFKDAKLPAGAICYQDSNAFIVSGSDSAFSTNQGSAQMKNGKYYSTNVKTGYPFTHDILLAIIPRR